MKTNLYITIVILILANVACKKKVPPQDHQQENHDMHNMSNDQVMYTCPMHPQIMKDKPGTCPICGMDLVEKKMDAPAHNNQNLNVLLKPTNQYALSQVKSIHPVEEQLPIVISASGKTTYDTREANTISARVDGRIEKLYIKYQYQQISVGQPIMDIYSKELLTEQENYIYILNNDSDNHSMIKTAETRLSLLGLNNNQIKQLRKTRKPFQYVTIHSNYAGHLHQLSDTQNSTSQSMSSTNMSNQEITIKEGMYVQKGQVIFNVYDTKKIWVLLYIYPDQISMIKQGQKVELTIDGIEHTIDAGIDFIEPIIQSNSQTPVVRVYIPNKKDQIKIGAIVEAKIFAGNKTGMFIPNSAIVHLGSNDVVFIKEGGAFKAQFIQKGIQLEDKTEIISGLTTNTEIALNAQYLIDSESFIKVYNE